MPPMAEQNLHSAYDKTAGEVIHNELTYRGIDWLANTAAAVGFAYWAARTHAGRVHYASNVEKGINRLLTPMVKDTATRAEWSQTGTGFVNIAVGGAAIIPPVMALEQHKRGITEWLDRRIYGQARVDSDPRFAARYEAIEQEPEKGFWTGMAARGVVLAPMLYAHMKYNTTMNDWLYEPIGRASKWSAETAGIKPHAMMQRMVPGSKRNDWDFLHNTIGMDLGLTFIYSFAHEYAYKSLTRLFSGGQTPAPSPSPSPTSEPEPASRPDTQPATQPDTQIASDSARIARKLVSGPSVQHAEAAAR